MRQFMAVLSLLIISFTAQAGYQRVEDKMRDTTVEEINDALRAHYNTLSSNEKWGVGMGCAIGRLHNLVKQSKSILIDSEAGQILTDSGYQFHLFRGQVRYRLKISFVPNSQEILVAQVTSTAKNGDVRTCSTRDKLFNF